MNWLLFRQELPHLRFVERTVDRSKADVRESRHAMAVDQHTRGHALYFVEFRELPLRIEAHVERGMKLLQEFVGVGAIPIEIDGNYLEALRTISALQNLHPRKRL